MAQTAQQKRDARAKARELKDRQAAAAKANGAPTPTEVLNTESAIHPDQVRSALGEIAKPQSAGVKVIVACKIGVAYLDIQHSRLVTKFEQNMQGGRDIREAERFGKVVRLRGTAYPRGTPPDGYPEKPMMVAGAALNFGIDKDWFDEWLRQNAKNPLVVNGLIFAHESHDVVAGMARETQGNVSGLEPLNPKGDRRSPKSTRDDLSNVETEENRAKKMARIPQQQEA